MDKNDKNPAWRRICSNCNKYGSEKQQIKSMLDGSHDVLIRATDRAGNFDIKEINFEID